MTTYEYLEEHLIGDEGFGLGDLATSLGAKGWRLVVATPVIHEDETGWTALFERPVAGTPPLKVPSAQRETFDSEWAELREVLRQQNVRLTQLEQIIRRRDEVVELARKGRCIHCGTHLAASFVGPLDRLDTEECS